MSSIDERVVRMEFENESFESKSKTTINTLQKLKKALNLDKETKSLDNLGRAASGSGLSVMEQSVSKIADRFSTLGIIGMSVLNNIANSAVNTGKQLISAFTLDPIIQGFREYETQLNSVQTILANTSSKGTTIDQVNAALDELNTYADKTIYNFAEMTRNIGTFTAAGVGLEMSVASIKGIANLAAASGSSASQAASAMYQLSQAIAAGRVSLMDWNSVVNAGMGGEQFQNALKRTAEHFGTDVDGMIEKYGSFRESLTRGQWLTSEVLTETLKQISGAYSEADLIAQGYTEQQAKDIVAFAKTAEDAATKVKTFTQLIDTAKEAIGSGWAQTWEIVFGDFEEAREMWTNASNVINDMISKSADARNAMFQGWKDGGGRQLVIEGVTEAFNNLVSVLGTIKEAFRNVFPPTTSKDLLAISKNFSELMSNLKPSSETLDKIRISFEGLFSVLDLVKQAIGFVGSLFGKFFGSSGFKKFASNVGDAVVSLAKFAKGVDEAAQAGGGFAAFASIMYGSVEVIASALGMLSSGLKGLIDLGVFLAKGLGNTLGKALEGLADAFGVIADKVSFGDVIAGLVGGTAIINFKKFGNIADTISEFVTSLSDAFDKFVRRSFDIGPALSSIHDALSAFTTGINTVSLLAISASVAILVSAVEKLSSLKIESVIPSVIAIAGLLKILQGGLGKILAILKSGFTKGLFTASVSMILIAQAIKTLSDAVVTLSKLSFEELAKGLGGVGIAMLELVGITKLMSKAVAGGSGLSGAISILILVQSLDEVASALKSIGKLSWDDIGKGLAGMGGALVELVAAVGIIGKISGLSSIFGATGILIAVQSLDEIASTLESLSYLSWDEIGRGLAAMGGALIEISSISGLLGVLTGFSGVLGGLGLTTSTLGLENLANAFVIFSELDWESIKRGLAGLGGALAEVSGITGLSGSLFGFGALVGAASFDIAVQGLDTLFNAFSNFGSMDWDSIQRGLAGMGGALVYVQGITGGIGYLLGLGELIGGVAFNITVQGLQTLFTAFDQFGSMNWDSIARGFAGMSTALASVQGITGSFGSLFGLGELIGSVSFNLTVQGLGTLYDAFSKFGTMDWGSIATGFTGMTAAMGSAGLGGLLNTLSGFGAESISTVAEPLVTLADAFSKFSTLNWGEIATGTAAMTAAMGATGLGGLLNTLSGFGAESISTVAEPLGVLADSIKKWATIVVPEGLGAQLGSIASAVNSFTFSGFGAGGLATVAEPLGKLADSVKKWTDVVVPEGLGEQLGSISSAIGSFTFTGMGAGGLSAVAEPLGILADSVKKWTTITIQEGFPEQLKLVADGIKQFAGMSDSSSTISELAPSMEKLANSMLTLTTLDFSSVSTGLTNMVDSLSSVPDNLGPIADSIAKLGDSITESLISGISDSSGRVGTEVNKMLSSALKTASSVKGDYKQLGVDLGNGLLKGIESKKGSIVNSVKTVVTAAKEAIPSNALYSAGLNLMQGLANGINAGRSLAVTAAANAASAAVAAAKRASGVNSPSWKFAEIGDYSMEGLALGYKRSANLPKKAVEKSIDGIMSTTKSMVSAMNNTLSTEAYMPTIQPVVDYSGYNASVALAGSKAVQSLAAKTSLSLGTTNSSIFAENRYVGEKAIVKELRKLGQDIRNLEISSYSVGNITYDDGTAVSNAVQDLAHAIMIDRRS